MQPIVHLGIVRPSRRAELHLAIEEPPGRWLLEEEDVPETPLHDSVIEMLELILKHSAARQALDVLISSNLACRWDPADARVGTDPDVVWVEPRPAEGEELSSLRVWEPGHPPPRIAVEVVSPSTANKDYFEAAARCALLGVRELWVFDPLVVGPDATGGPYRIQVWRRVDETGSQLTRVYAGPGPAQSEELGAWLIATENPHRLRLADDEAGEHLWPTAEEAALQLAEQEKARAEQEKARAEQEKVRAEQEKARAEQEKVRAEQEKARAEQEKARADAAEEELRSLRAQLAISKGESH